MSDDALATLWREDFRDRLSGRAARANARWGFLTPPPGGGKLVWIQAAASRESVLLGVEALRAIRDRRLDLRLALTFHTEYPDLLARLRGLAKIGLAYGPADRTRIARRVLDRLAPLGVVIAGHAPPGALARALSARKIHAVALNAPAANAGRFEAVYPANTLQGRAWAEAGTADRIDEAADLLTLLVEAQVDPNFRSQITGGQPADLWWLQGLHVAAAEEFMSAWCDTTLKPTSLLFVSAPPDVDPRRLQSVFARRGPAVSMRAWARSPLDPGSTVVIDDPRWLPAIAAAANGIHLVRPSRLETWQALASGAPVSAATVVAGMLNEPPGDDALAWAEDWRALMLLWRAWRDDPIGARRRGDAARRLFWAERRRATQATERFLQRVFEW